MRELHMARLSDLLLTCQYWRGYAKARYCTCFPGGGCDKPHNMRMAVVFPAPLAPRETKKSLPCLTLNEIWSTAVKLPELFGQAFYFYGVMPVTCGVSLIVAPFRRKRDRN